MLIAIFSTFLTTTACYGALLFWGWTRLRKACREDSDSAKAIVILLRGKMAEPKPEEVSRCEQRMLMGGQKEK